MNKTLSYKELRSIHMKFLLLCGVGVLLWTNYDARKIIADGLQQSAEIVRPQRYWLCNSKSHKLILILMMPLRLKTTIRILLMKF